MNKNFLENDLWVGRYGDMLYRYTLIRVNDTDIAQEIVQITLVAAVEASKSFEGKSSEKTWLFGILKHKIYDHYRREKKQYNFKSLQEDYVDPDEYKSNGTWKSMLVDWRMSPEEAANNGQLREAISVCLEKLPENYRRIFVLREIEGFSSEAICKEFDIRPTNIWIIMHRARNQLRKCLEIHWINKV